jgi:hypothetical protein
MGNRRIEIALITIATALLIWGFARAVSRGEPATKGWTTFAMFGLVVLCAGNLFFRSNIIAYVVVAACTLFVLLVLAAALLGAPAENPNRIPAVIRSLLFFLSIGAAGLLQLMSGRDTNAG